MKIFIRLCLLAALGALGFWLWTVFFPSPETVIRKHINKVAELLTFDSKEGQFARLANVQELTGFFSPDVEIVVDTPAHGRETMSGREELSQKAMGARMVLGGLQVDFVDLNVTLNAGGTEATVLLTGRASVAGDRDQFVQELKFTLRKIDGDWLIVRIETIRTLT